MKKLVSLFLAGMMLCSAACAFAELADFSFLDDMGDDALVELRGLIDDTLQQRKKTALQDGVEDEVEATRANPAPLGATVLYEERDPSGNEYALSIASAVKGKGAAAVMKSFDRYARKVKKGEEWVMVLLHIEALASDTEKVELSEYDFRFVSKDGVEYESSYFSNNPAPVTPLYVGSQQYAWVATVVKENDTPFLTYKRMSGYSENDNVWFNLSGRVFKGNEITAETLQKGDDADEITVLQRLLLEMNYLQAAPNGEFDKNTISAVKSFQKANGLKSSGSADAETIQMLLSGKAK